MFILDEENALIGFRADAIQTLNLILLLRNDFEVSDCLVFVRVGIAGNTPREITGNNDSLQELLRHIASVFKLGSLLLELICLKPEWIH